ncbi:uncharacterized protein LOC122404998 [Colletes gigas]|uniref:uncharacterized protein LOC122404998 n=1 Tax=Colletes gigas TaxID=935657 RepID=UPI001C9B391C|nr:uncharacterized protein LOC122404998 [Colletes gigas]
MQSFPNVIYLFLVVFILGTTIVLGEPEPMARPTRPEVFSSPDELRKYLDHVSDYYSLSGKARYGKRGDGPFAISDDGRAWDTVKTILDVSQQPQQPRFEKRKLERRQFFRELDSSGDRKQHGTRIDARPCHVLDIDDKYYDDVQ